MSTTQKVGRVMERLMKKCECGGQPEIKTGNQKFSGASHGSEVNLIPPAVISNCIWVTGAMGDFATVSKRDSVPCSRTIRVLTQCDHTGPAPERIHAKSMHKLERYRIIFN